jgi:hypothetical protein
LLPGVIVLPIDEQYFEWRRSSMETECGEDERSKEEFHFG